MNVSVSTYKPSDILSTLAKTLPKQQFSSLIQKEISPILDKLPQKHQQQIWDSICAGLPPQIQNELPEITDLVPFLTFRYSIQFDAYLGIVKSYPNFNDALLSMAREAVFEGACKDKEVPWMEALQIFHFGESVKDVVKLLQAIDQKEDIKDAKTVKRNALIYLMDVHGTGSSMMIEAKAEDCLEKWLKEILCTFFEKLAQFFPNLEEEKTRLQVELGRLGMLVSDNRWPLSKREKRKEILARFAEEAKTDILKTNPNSSLKKGCNSVKKLSNEMGIWVEILDGYSKRKGANTNMLCDAILQDWVDNAIYDIVGAADALES